MSLSLNKSILFSPRRPAVFLPAVLLACLLVPAPSLAEVTVLSSANGLYQVRFRCRPEIAATSISVAGSFNQWNKESHRLSDEDHDGVWEATFSLPGGEHPYKFVLNGFVWKQDLDNPRTVPDGFQGCNSLLSLGQVPTAPGTLDGKITGTPVHRDELFFLYRDDDGSTVVRLAHLEDDLSSVVLCLPGAPGNRFPMKKIGSRDHQDVYETRVPPEGTPKGKPGTPTAPGAKGAPPPARPPAYFFRLRDGSTVRFAGPQGLSDRPPHPGFRFAPRQVTPPAWLDRTVAYQIFPDRFDNGSLANDPPDMAPWGAPPTYTSFFGGDLQGIENRIPYLTRLGVNLLYLCPVFRSPSNHRYDTQDYYQVDPRLGTREDLVRLSERLHQAGIRLLLDGVFNHTSDKFYAFQDVFRRGPKSPYWSWYTIYQFPFEIRQDPAYACWWGFGQMPKLHTGFRPVTDYLLDVAGCWTREAGLDGWRLDVPEEVPPAFWREFRTRVKEVRPDAYLLGEIWCDGKDWLQGDRFDGIMHYRLRQLALDFFTTPGSPPAGFVDTLEWWFRDLPPPAWRGLYHLSGSHDTVRLATLARGDPELAKSFLAFLFLLPGLPAIYYGDEIGMEGGKDPDNRRCFPWRNSPEDSPLFAWTRDLVKLRRERSALAAGRLLFVRRWHPEWLVLERPGDGKGNATLAGAWNLTRSPLHLPDDLAAHGTVLLASGSPLVPPGGVAILRARAEINSSAVSPRPPAARFRSNP